MNKKQIEHLLMKIQIQLSAMTDYHDFEKEVFMNPAYADGLVEQTFEAFAKNQNFKYMVYRLQQAWGYAFTEEFAQQLADVGSILYRTPIGLQERCLLLKWLSMMGMCVPRIQIITYTLNHNMTGISNRYRYVAKRLLRDNEKMPLGQSYWAEPVALSVLQKIPEDKVITGGQVYSILKPFPRTNKWHAGIPEDWFDSKMNVQGIYDSLLSLAVTAGSGFWDSLALQECIILLGSVKVYGSFI